jgi:hypothetical protein
MIGHLYIVTAPSGAGKTTLVRLLLANDPAIRVSVSHSTRAPRVGERDGLEYHFVGVDDFLEKVRNDDFLEWAEVHGNYYGTSRSGIETDLLAGQDVCWRLTGRGRSRCGQCFRRRLVFSSCHHRSTSSSVVFAHVRRIVWKRSPVASRRHAKRCGMWPNSTMLLSTTTCSVRCRICWRGARRAPPLRRAAPAPSHPVEATLR